jgi:hypothetical protein
MLADAVHAFLTTLIAMGNRLRISLSCLVLGVFIAGCGDEKEGPVSKPVAQQASAVCQEVNHRAGGELLEAYDLRVIKIAADEDDSLRLEEKILIPILISAAEDLESGLGGLEVPFADEGQIESVVDAYGAWIEEAKADPGEVVAASDNFNTARRLAKEYGLGHCAQSPYEVS